MTVQETVIEKVRHLPDPLAKEVEGFIDRLVALKTLPSSGQAEAEPLTDEEWLELLMIKSRANTEPLDEWAYSCEAMYGDRA